MWTILVGPHSGTFEGHLLDEVDETLGIPVVRAPARRVYAVGAGRCPPDRGVGHLEPRHGGTVDPFGTYHQAWSTGYTNGSSTVGPVAGGTLTPSPTMFANSVGGAIPDGTARFPWNGYAGENISIPGPQGSLVVNFPAGTCTLPAGAFDRLLGAVPSPDGKLIAELLVNTDIPSGSQYTINIVKLAPAPACGLIVSATYTRGVGSPTTGSSIDAAFVWKPDSTAILFQEDPGTNLTYGPASINRLNAVAGATPTTIIPASAPGTAGCRTPLGWTIKDRILVNCWSFPLTAPLTITSTLESLPVTGGPRRVLDTAVLRRQVGSDYELYYHYGYYVPNSEIVIFNSGSTLVGSNPSLPAFQIRTIPDVAGATSSPFVPPVNAQHHESVFVPGGGVPPYAQVSVPNADLVARFGH